MAKKYDVMNDMMSLGIHRLWKDLLLWKMHPFPGTQLLDVAGGTGDIAFRFLNYVQAQHQRKQKRQLRAQQNLSWEEIAKKYQNEEDSLGGSHVMICDINREMLKIEDGKPVPRDTKLDLIGYWEMLKSYPLMMTSLMFTPLPLGSGMSHTLIGHSKKPIGS